MEASNLSISYESNTYKQNVEDLYNNPFQHDFLSTQQNSNINIISLENDEEGDNNNALISKDDFNSLYIPAERNEILENKNDLQFTENSNIIEEIGYNIKKINTNVHNNTKNQKDDKNSADKTTNLKIIGHSKPKEKITSLFDVIYIPRKMKHESEDEDKNKIENRFEDKDNILVKLKTNFFNSHIYVLLKKNLKDCGSHIDVSKFPHNFVIDVHKNEKNKELWNMTLSQFLNENDKYKDIENNVLVKKNKNFKEKLNKRLCELYKEYIASPEFQKNVLKKIELKYDTFYAERVKKFSDNFLNYFSVYE